MKWLRGPIGDLDAAAYEAAGFGVIGEGEIGAEVETVEALLESLQRDRRAHCRFSYKRSPIVLEGLIPVPLVPLYWPKLVAAMGAAAARGGQGELALHLKSKQAMRVTLADGEAVLANVNLAAERAAKAPPVRVPGVVDRAPTGRATCKACRGAIEKGTYRFGMMDVARSRPDAPTYRWLHVACAAAAVPWSVGPLLRPMMDEAELGAAVAKLAEGALDAPKPEFFRKGDPVRLPDGRVGAIAWFGPDKFGGGLKVGVEVQGAEKAVYAAAHTVTRVQ